jgi:hypothetical protein
MKKLILIVFCISSALTDAFAQYHELEQDINDIKQVIMSAYVEGIHNAGEVEAVEQGFHPGFDMLILQNNALNKLAIYNWLISIKRRKADPANSSLPEVTCKFLDVDVTGDAAVVKLELHREGTLLFTDYLCLYRFEEGWKIVTKLFHRH